MVKITPLQVQLAEQLLISIVKKEPTIEYNEIAERVTPKIKNPRNVGKEIGEVSKLCHELNLPLISAKVVGKGTNSAGAGFYAIYEMFGIDTAGYSEKELFRLELKKIRECTEWHRLAEHLNITIDGLSTGSIEKQIRILPMSKDLEFKNYSVEDIQKKYFLGDLVSKQNGFYYFRKEGMNRAPNSLVLFQFDGEIIASAILKATHKNFNPVDDIYKGSFEFSIDSIKIFEPIGIEELRDIVPEIEGFSQVKQKINWDYWDKINHLILQKQIPLYPDDLYEQGDKTFMEGAKKQVTVNAYERNPAARRDCINEYGCKCVICGFDFGAFYGEQFCGKIHVHHINPLHLVEKEYKINPKSDLAPVCPNCHMIVHAKENGVYSIEEVKILIAKQNR